MSGSFRKIDYSLRPAKHAERRMLAEIFRRLSAFQPVEEYAYVGFGSIWFTDFSLFHRLLGVRDMVSFEKSSGSRDRVEANKPFDVRVDYRSASVALGDLDWTRRHFIWLDYDDPISEEMLYDLRLIAGKGISGTLVAVSAQAVKALDAIDAEKDPSGPKAIERFRQRFGRERVGDNVYDDDLYGWPFAALSRRMFIEEVEQTLSARNASGEVEQAVQFTKICEIEYADDAKMTTVVGLLTAVSDNHILEMCGFEKLDFLRRDGPTRVTMPKLTIRELRSLEKQLPLRDGKRLDVGSMPSSDAKNFSEMYRYFPSFAVLEGG